MSDATLTDLFRQQAQRRHLEITAYWQVWQAGDESVLTPLCHAVHLLKGAALSASADAVAQTLHELESRLQPGQQTDALGCWPALLAALQPWLADAPLSFTTSPESMRRAFREGFAAQLRLSGQPATLHLQLDPYEPFDLRGNAFLWDAFLWDVLPQLLRNSLVHGGEPGAVRLAAGKPERLQVWLRLRRRGECISLVVADDGRGQARPQQTPDLMAGRGWGVAAVHEVVAGLPSGRLAFRCRAGAGSVVRIQWRVCESVQG
ncbi:MAG: Hpt domain-containing protein [Pseudomonadota bacterium]